MNVLIKPRKLTGSISVPPSKSLSHRMIIAASLAKGKSVISNIVYSEDVLATIGAMEKIGVKFIKNPNQLIVNGVSRIAVSDDNFIECNESGSTLRFLIPLLSLSRQKIVFTGKKSLFQRPLGIYENLFGTLNLQFQKNEDSLIVSGSLVPGEYEIPGNVSSQFISGLLFALPLLKGDSKITVTSPFESRQYVDMTVSVLKSAGIEISEKNQIYHIRGSQTYEPIQTRIEGDFSQMAFFAVMGLIGAEIECTNIPETSIQPDFQILDFIRKAKGQYVKTETGFLFKPSQTSGNIYDVSQSPDIAPVLAVLISLSHGDSRIENAARLKFKESNRLLSTYNTLRSLGVEVEMTDDALKITGRPDFEGGVFESYGDHRIVMSAAAASVRCKKPVLIRNAEAVQKSYPDFFRDLESLGAEITYLEE